MKLAKSGILSCDNYRFGLFDFIQFIGRDFLLDIGIQWRFNAPSVAEEEFKSSTYVKRKEKSCQSQYLSNPAKGVTDVITILPLGRRGCKFNVSGVKHNRGLEDTQQTIVSSKYIGGGM